MLPKNKGALFELKKNPNDLNEQIKLKLIGKIQVNHNSYIFKFELPDKNMPLGINLGQHIAFE